MALEAFSLIGRIALQGAEKVQQGLKNIGNDAKAAEQASSKFGSMLSGAATAGVLAIGAALAGAGIAAFSFAADSEKALGMIQAQLGLTKTEAQGAMDQATDLWKKGYGADINEAASAVSEVSKMLGLNGEAAGAAAEKAMIIGEAFGGTVSENARAADSLMKNFGVSSDEAFDLITKGYQNGLDYSGEFLDTINEYSVHFKELGFTAPDMFNKLSSAAEEGSWNLDKAADAVKEFNLRGKDIDASGEAFEALGFDAEEMTGKFTKGGKEGAEAFNEVIQKLSGVKDGTEANKIATALFGTQYEDLQMEALLALGSTEDKMGELEGATAKAGQALKDNFSTNMTILWRTFLDALAPVGEKLLEFANDWIPKVTAAVEGLGAYLSGEGGAAALDTFKQAWDGIKTAFQWIIDNWTIIVAGLAGVAGAFAAFQIITAITSAISFFNIALAAMRAGTLLATLAQYGLNTAMLLNPITWIVIAIGLLIAAIVAIWLNWDKVSGFLKASWATIKSVAGSIFKGIGNAIGAAFRAIGSTAKGIWNGIVNFLSGIWNSLKSKATGAFNGIKGAIQTAWNTIKSKTVSTISTLVSTAISKFNSFKSKVTSVFNGVRDAIKSAIDKAKSAVGTAVDYIRSKFSGLKLKLPNIKIPKFSISGDFGIKPPRVPKFGISWHKKGGFFDQASVLTGLGENGREAIIPLQNRRYMQPFSEAIAANMASMRGGVQRLEVPIFLNGREILRAILPDLDRELAKKQARYGGLVNRGSL